MATKNTAQTAGQKAAATKAANKAKTAEAADETTKPAKAVKAAPAKTAPAKAPKVKAAPAPEAVEAEEEVLDNNQSIGRKELATALYADLKAAGFGAPEKLCVHMVQSFEKVVSDAIAKGTDVVLPGFGKFKTTLRAAGERRNPRSGESMTVAASWAVGFKPGKTLKDAANSRPAA